MDGEFTIRKIVMPNIYLAFDFLQPPPSSTRPHVIGYNVSHNASGTVNLYETNDTKFVLESESLSSFDFIVAAINVLGAGEESDITSEYVGASVFYRVYIKSQPTNLITVNFTRSK